MGPIHLRIKIKAGISYRGIIPVLGDQLKRKITFDFFQKKGAKQPNEEIKDARKASNGIVGEAVAGNINRNRSPSKMTKYVECWGADKPFANITESTLAKNIGLTVIVNELYEIFTKSL